ncbi:hypothetical protein ACJD0Z_02935 [Flavobacteriaceae bacterium M23B6Z8]
MNTNKDIRVIAYICAFTLLFSINLTLAQVGIGTTSPDASSVLDVTAPNDDAGVLFPRLTTTQRDAISSPATGLLIYNTDENEFQYNFGTPAASNWVSIKNSGAEPRTIKYKYNNFASNPNLNETAGQVAPLFVELEWNDDTSLYQKTANGFLTINESGRYRFTVNIELFDSAGSNNLMALYAFLRINGTEVGAAGSTAIFLNSSGNANDYSSINFSDIHDINAGDSISVIVYRDAGSGTVILSGTDFSNILIEKLE